MLLSADYQIMTALTLINNLLPDNTFLCDPHSHKIGSTVPIENRNGGTMGSGINQEEGTAKEKVGRKPHSQQKA